MSLLIMTRCMFGWSMDRVAPASLAKVSYRTNSPYVSVIVVTAISAVVSYFWAYSSRLTVVVGAFPQVITLAIGCLAAALIPFRQRDLYETSPIRGYFGRIPKLTVLGLLGVIGALVIVWNFARDPSSGVDPSNHPGMFWFSLAFFPFGFVLYYVSVVIRRRQGIDLGLAFREIRRTDVTTEYADRTARAQQILSAAEERDLAICALGGVAVQLLCASARPDGAWHRGLADVDLATTTKARRLAEEVIAANGFVADDTFNRMNGSARLRYFDADGSHLDVFVDELQLCHTISWHRGLARRGANAFRYPSCCSPKLQVVKQEDEGPHRPCRRY